MRKDFDLVRQALEEHLSSINENTSEIQALFEYLHQLEVKVDKLNNRLDEQQMSTPVKREMLPLNQVEKQVFLVLYTEEKKLSVSELAQKAKLPISMVQECITSLGKNGIPLHRSYFDNQLLLSLDQEFKEMQAKENLVNLSLRSFIE